MKKKALNYYLLVLVTFVYSVTSIGFSLGNSEQFIDNQEMATGNGSETAVISAPEISSLSSQYPPISDTSTPAIPASVAFTGPISDTLQTSTGTDSSGTSITGILGTLVDSSGATTDTGGILTGLLTGMIINPIPSLSDILYASGSSGFLDTLTVTLEDLLSVPGEEKEYIPFAHIGSGGSETIVYSPEDIALLKEKGQIISSYYSGGYFPNAVMLTTDISYRTPDNQIQVTMPEELVIEAKDDEPFDAQNLELIKNTGDTSFSVTERYNDENNTYMPAEEPQILTEDQKEFHFGISGQHLLFSKPLAVTLYSDKADGTQVDISANHANQGRTKDGISTDPNTECVNGSATIPGSTSIVTNNTINFYICGASVFSITYTGYTGAFGDLENFALAGFITKTGRVITGVDFGTSDLITDVDIRIIRRPSDQRNTDFPPGTGGCGPTQKYFRLKHPDGTTINLINSGQLQSPLTNCVDVTSNFDMSGTNSLTGVLYSGTYKPAQSLTGLNGKSPFGDRSLIVGDTGVSSGGTILYGYILSITTDGTVENPKEHSEPGTYCVFAPDLISTGSYISTTTGQVEQFLGMFSAAMFFDSGYIVSGFYTTLSASPLIQSGGSGIIGISNMQRKAGYVSGFHLDGVLRTGNTDRSLNENFPTVRLSTGRSRYTTIQGVRTFIVKDGNEISKYYKYGSNVWLKYNIPPYTPAGVYRSIITYTLYDVGE